MSRRDAALSYFSDSVISRMKEAIMNTADILIHVHPELDAQARTDLERASIARSSSTASIPIR